MSTSETTISLNTLLHLLTIKLSSTNYLLWKNQIHPLLSYQDLLGHIDGSSPSPSPTIEVEGKSAPNPLYTSWYKADQQALLIIQSSLSEEAMAETLGLNNAYAIWKALEDAYSHDSMERVHTLRDTLRQLQKGSSTVPEYGRKFKAICDQLAAIGQPVDELDKAHWFLCGLGSGYESFSTTHRAIKPAPPFRSLLSQAESHELFLNSIHHSSTPPPAAFTAQQHWDSQSSSRGGSSNRGNFSGGRGRGNSSGGRGRGRRSPHCQLCRNNGHYASSCPDLPTFAKQNSHLDANLAQAFQNQCNLTQSRPDWYVDSGASAHMTNSSANLDHSTPYSGSDQVVFGNGNVLNISRIGNSTLSNNIKLLDVLVVPHLTKNLLSISKLTDDSPVDILLSNKFFVIQNRINKAIIATGKREDGLYVLQQGTKAFVAALKNKCTSASFEIWHSRLGHVAFDTVSLLHKFGSLSITSILPKPGVCTSCQLSKSMRLPFSDNFKRAKHVLDLIHCDLWGPAPIASTDGFLYYVIFVDDYSRFTWFYPLKRKSDFAQTLSTFLTFVQTQFGCKVKEFQSDGGTEFLNHRISQLFITNGTHHRVSCPYTPQQNGRAERKHRHITETGLAMLFNARAPATFWVHAFSSAVYIINRLPTKILTNKSPFEVLFDIVPNYNIFRVFGCRVFPYLRDYAPNKLAPRSAPCIFIGYCTQYKGYKCLDPSTQRIYTTRHAQFDENSFPFTGTLPPCDTATMNFTTFDEAVRTSTATAASSLSPPAATDAASSPTPCKLCPISPGATTTEPQQPPVVADITDPVVTDPPLPSSNPTDQPAATSAASAHPMITRSRDGIFKKKHFVDLASLGNSNLITSLLSTTVPKGFKSAAKHPHWLMAMEEEMSALRSNNTWDLVPRPANSNVVGSKWIFRTKFNSDGTIDRYKARLVAQGFTQVPGLDYSLTFSPVVKSSTVRIVLSIAVMQKWPLHQLDVKNAFLNGCLTDKVFMEQPPGFIDDQFPLHVCRLNKALYGLKQAPRAWFQRLSAFLVTLGFYCSRADPSLFVFKRGSTILYLLVYVDDIILTGNNSALIRTFITRLNTEFAIKDLGKLSYFLGLEATYTDDGLFLTQAKYAHDILTRAGLLESKPTSTPLSPSDQLLTIGDQFSDPTLYRSLVGALQYLTITRPDLSYAVNQVSQFLQSPTVDHFQAVKRILRYVKGTLSFGLHFRRPQSSSILGYSDADWARCIETRRSTYGYSIFLGGNLVSWSAKKQPTVSRSSCESEYHAMANTASEIVWVTHLLRELHALPSNVPTLLCDNKSALFLSQNPISHKRAKHIDIDYHFVRELVSSGKLQTKYIPTHLQLADIFTKSLPRPLFEQFRAKLRVGPPPLSLKGGIGDKKD
ncbi:hypothetical protein L1887_36372 [Cichorium endivia]|nr:hypothetical protein L1887_36372 [Cichorium endivia]